MDSVRKLNLPGAFSRQFSTDFKLCFICQINKKKEKLICPKSDSTFQSIINSINKRAELGDPMYQKIQKRISENALEEMVEKGAMYHRGCYSKCTHKSYLQSLESKQSEMSLDVLQDEAIKKTRSQTIPFDKNKCIFCNGLTSKKNPLRKVATSHAGKFSYLVQANTYC